MRIIARLVPGLVSLSALVVIGGLVGLHVQDALKPPLGDSLPRAVGLPRADTPAIPGTIDAEGCRALPDGLRICDMRASAASAAPGLRFPERTKAERPPRAEAMRVVDWIVRIAGVARNFEVIEGDFKDGAIAFATIREGRRLIVYDARMFDWGRGRVRWRHVAIMAHEIAHHLNGDTTGSHGPVHSHEQELAADYFAGFVVAHLGGTLEQALEMSNMLSEEVSDSHPARQTRRESIADGWNTGHAIAEMPSAGR